MKVQDVVYEVVDAFLEHFSCFPMRFSFHTLAGALISDSQGTVALFKERARDSVSQLPYSLFSTFNAGKAPARSMQTTRTAFNVFNVLDTTALKLGVNSSADITNERRAKKRGLIYDGNAKNMRLLSGALPVWIKSFPTLFMVSVRCAVKVAQRKYFTATANLEGNDVPSVFTDYTKGETVLELENLCNKLGSYLESLRGFVGMNCVIPDMDPTESEMNNRKLFLEALQNCASLLSTFNEIVPILYVIDSGLRRQVEEAWKFESEDIADNMADRLQGHERGMLFCEKPESPSTLMKNIKFFHEVATSKGDLQTRIGCTQISIIASSEDMCSTIARSSMQNLRNFGSIERENGRKKRKVDEGSTSGLKDETRSEFIRNNLLQADLYFLWSSVISGDSFFDKQLLSTNDRHASSLQIYLSDEWYEILFSSVLAPSLVECGVDVPDSDSLLSAFPSVLSRFVEK